MSKPWQVVLCGSFLLLGCSADEEPVDIGDTATRTGQEFSDFVGTWDGYGEGIVFGDGSDRVRLTINEDHSGVFMIGDTPPVGPAEDPDVWPYGEAFFLRHGIEYPVLEVQAEQRRIRVKVDLWVLSRPWCELQTPILDEQSPEESYSCMPNDFQEIDHETGLCYQRSSPLDDPQEVDCGKASMCRQACVCDANGCTTDSEPVPILDAAWAEDGEALFGTVTRAVDNPQVSPGFSAFTARLYRQP